MALVNPANLYSGGQGILRDDYVNFIANQEAKKQAKQEALDRAMGERMAKLTPTGMRTEDVPALLKLKNDIQSFYIKNKDAINNPSRDGGKAWGELNSMYNRGSALTEGSKGAAKVETDFYALGKNPETLDRIDESTFREFDKHKQPIAIVDKNGAIIDNPNFVPFDMSKVVFNPKGYTAKDWDEYYRRAENVYGKERKEQISFAPTEDPYLNLETSTKSFAPETLSKVADDAVNDYLADKNLSYSFNKSHSLLKVPFDKWRQEHIQQYNELNDIYKKVKGKSITAPEELHAAEVIKKMSTPIVESKTIPNQAKRQSDKEKLAYLNDRLIRGRSKQAGGDGEELAYPTVEYADKYGFDVTETDKATGQKKVIGRYIDADEVPRSFMELVNPTDYNKGVMPVKPIVFNDKSTGKQRRVFQFDPQTGAWIGQNGRIDPDYAKDQYIGKLLPSKFRAQVGSKGKFSYKGGQEKKEQNTKKKVYNPKTGRFE